jgi:hypothetical protein
VSLRAIKRGLLLFWVAWTGIVVATNGAEVLKALHLLPELWAPASGNYLLMVAVGSIYGTPRWVMSTLFGGVLLWQAVGTAAFGRAVLTTNGTATENGAISRAFAVNLALWAAFMITDEVFLAYGGEETHRSIFAAQLLTLLAIRLLPEE